MRGSGVQDGEPADPDGVGRDPLRLPRNPVDAGDGKEAEDEPFWHEEDPEEAILAGAVEDTKRMTEAMRVRRQSEHDLEKYVLAFIHESDKLPNWRDQGVFHPSEMGKEDFCQRLEVFKRSLPKDYQKPIDPERFGYFSIGKAIHHWWQTNVLGKARVLRGTWECTRCRTWVEGYMPNHPCTKCAWPLPARTFMGIRGGPVMKKGGIVLKPKWHDPVLACKKVCRWPGGYDEELRDCARCEFGGSWEYVEPAVVHPELEIAGHCDGILVLHGQEYALELKTVSPFQFPNLEEPYPEHHYQVSIYMHVLKVKKALITYVVKDSGRIKTFLVKEDPEAWKDAKWQIGIIQEALKNDGNRLPEGVCEHDRTKTAKACPYREECFGGYNTIRAIKASLEKQAAARLAQEAKRRAAGF